MPSSTWCAAGARGGFCRMTCRRGGCATITLPSGARTGSGRRSTAPCARRCARAREKKAPGAAIFDAQSVKVANHPGVRGYDAGKKIRGRKRHRVADTLGLILGVVVTGAEVSDRAGALEVLPPVLRAQPPLEQLWADAGYAGGTLAEDLRAHAAHPGLRLDIVKRQRSGSQGLRRAAQALDRGTHLRLAHAGTPSCPRLRNQNRLQRSHDPRSSLSYHAPQTRQMTFYTVSKTTFEMI